MSADLGSSDWAAIAGWSGWDELHEMPWQNPKVLVAAIAAVLPALQPVWHEAGFESGFQQGRRDDEKEFRYAAYVS